MNGEGITRAAIERATQSAREQGQACLRDPRMVERMERSARDVAAAKAKLEESWKAGDRRARQLLRELYPTHPLVEAERAAAVLTHMQRSEPREPGEEG